MTSDALMVIVALVPLVGRRTCEVSGMAPPAALEMTLPLTRMVAPPQLLLLLVRVRVRAPVWVRLPTPEMAPGKVEEEALS